MTTIQELAAEYDMQPYELRAFADDMLDGMEHDDVEIPEDVEKILRETLVP